MPYSAEISRRNPSCIVFLLDQSGSMNEEYGLGNVSKAQGAANTINRFLQELILKCTKEGGVKDYFDIAIVGYGSKQQDASPLIGQKFVKLPWLAENPLRVEERMMKEEDGAGGVVEVKVKFRIWFEPVASSDTPMCKAMEFTYDLIKDWTASHRDAFPPMIFNITDGEATDGDPENTASKIKQLSTSDGDVLMYNCHISGTKASAILFPESEDELPADQFAKKLFRMSSTLPESIWKLAQKEGFNAGENSRGFAFNADLVLIADFLDIGTRVSREMLR